MDGTPKKYTKVNEQVLKDFAVTLEGSPNLSEKEILAKFPEFENDVNAIQSARDYWATVGDNPTIPKDIATKFPEFDFGGTTPAEKKNEKPATVSPVGGGSSDLPKIKYDGKEYGYNPSTLQVFQADGTELKQVKHLGKTYDVKDYLTNVIGLKPQTQKPQAEKPAEQPKPYTTSQVAVELKKKVELNPALKGVAKIYKDYNAAKKNLLNAQMDLTAGLQGEKDVIQTDVLGKPVAIQGSITEQKIKRLKENVDLAKANKQAAKENLIKVSPAFKDKNIDIVAELQKDNIDVEETVIPQAVEKIKFVEDISDLEDNLKANGQTLDDWSKYVNTEAPKEFLDDKQRALFDVIKTGDEAKIKTATDVYYKDIDDQISQIDKDITALSVGKFDTEVDVPQRVADLRKEKQDLLSKKQGFLQPAAALKQVSEIDPSFGLVDEMFAKISPMQRVKMTLDNLYAKRVKQKSKLDAMLNSPLTVLKNALPFQNEIKDLQADITKTDQAIRTLAPVAFLNQKPDMEQSNWTRLGRGVWNTMLGEGSGVTFPKKEDISDTTTSLMATSQTLDNISIAGKKALKETVPTLTDKAIDMAAYMTAIGVTYAPVGGIVKAYRLPGLARMAFGNIGKYSPLMGRIAPSLTNMFVEGVTSEATGRLLGGDAQQDLTFLSKFGAQGATELFNKSPFGKLVTKAVSSLGIKEVPKFVNILANINSAGTGSLIEEGVEEGIVLYQNSDSFADFKKQLKQFVDSPSDLFLFVASSYALGGFTSGLSPNVSKKFYAAADKAYNDLPPNEKAAFDNVVKDVNQGQEDAVMEVVLKTVDKIPNKVVDGLVTDLNTAVEKLGKTEVGENGYEVKIGDTVYQGNTAQDLQNDIDDAQSLLAIYKGEQDNRKQNGITIEETETPPIAEADQTDVELAKPEAGVGVEGEVVPEDVKKRITELEDMLSGDALSMQEKGMGTLVDRQSVVDELADLKKKYNIEPKPIAKAAPTFENVPVFTYTPQDVEKAKNEVFDNLSKLQVGSVIENSDGEIKVVTDYTTDKKGNRLIGVVTFTRLEDGSLLQRTNPVFASKSADGKIKLDYNPHTTGRNAKGEQVTVTDQITDKTIDLSKENIFIQDENGNLVKTNAFSTTTTQTAPQEGVTEPTKAPVIKAQVVGTTAGLNTIIDGGLGKQQDPRFTGEVQQGKSIFKVNPNNNESSFLDISLPSSDSFGRSGGVQIRFELPNGVDANTVFEAVKKEAAKLGRLDAKDPDFKSKVQGLVDKGIAEIQGLATGGAKQAAQVKETVSEKQVPPTETSENPALKNVASTATALSKLDKGTIDATLPMQPLEIDGYKREYRTDSPLSIAEAYHKAKADGSNPDLVKAVEELLAPKGEVKAEPSVKAETTPTEKVDETTESPATVTVDTGTVENAPTQAPIAPTQIEGLINGGTKRTAALESIEDTQVKEVAKKLTQPKFFDNIYAKIDLDDPMLLELQEKLGFKKICE